MMSRHAPVLDCFAFDRSRLVLVGVMRKKHDTSVVCSLFKFVTEFGYAVFWVRRAGRSLRSYFYSVAVSVSLLFVHFD